LRVTVPDRIGSFDPRGSTVVFETVVDDYAEVWVDGRLPRELGQSGGSLVRGFNAPNRLVIARGAQPGQTIQLAVFAMNGPISDPPANFIWMRSAKLDFYGEPHAVAPRRIDLAIERLDPALDAIVPPGTPIEQIAEGFVFTEGPVWTPNGELWFSDPNRNRIYAWKTSGALSVVRERSGYDGQDIGAYTQPGSNGLAFDAQGRLTVCEHGNRRISRIEKDGRVVVLAERHEGRRLNSPNDLVYRSDGALYFSDPPFGLPAFHADPRRELDVTGVYCLKDRKLALVSADLKGPNGLAFSPDERFLYVTNWDEARKVVMRYAVQPDGSLASGETFFDMGGAPQSEALDGVKVDVRGNLFVSGPGGTWILAPDGRHLGTLRGPELAANFAWGDADRRTLFWTARGGVYRMRVATGGRVPARLDGTH
jgi:gluconolactonase